MQYVQLVNVNASLKGQGNEEYRLRDLSLTVSAAQQWVLLGENGAGKSAVAAVIAGCSRIEQGQFTNNFARIAVVSPDRQKQLLADELNKDQDDIIDGLTPLSTVKDIILADRSDHDIDTELLELLIKTFDFDKYVRNYIQRHQVPYNPGYSY